MLTLLALLAALLGPGPILAEVTGGGPLVTTPVTTKEVTGGGPLLTTPSGTDEVTGGGPLVAVRH